MADQKINELPTKSAPSSGDKMLMIGTEEEYQIDYDQLATAILNKLSTQSFSSLDTTSKTVLGAIDELNSKSYLLRGGTLIPENADLDDYGTIGNYYCNSSAVAGTLTHSPFSTAFTMKIELSAGTSYACQTAIKYNNGQKAWRYHNGSSWIDWIYFSDNATLANNLLSTVPYTVTFDEITPGAAQTKNVSVHRYGHKPIGCVGWANTKSSDFYLYQCSVNDIEMLSAFAKNVGDSTIPSGATVIVNVLFVKDS